MGRSSALAREISFVSFMAYGPKVSDSALTKGVTASETRQGSSQHMPGTKDKQSMFLSHIDVSLPPFPSQIKNELININKLKPIFLKNRK